MARQGNVATNWGRIVYVALTLLTIGIVWALVLGSILVVRSGETSSAVLDMLATSHTSREEGMGELQREREETSARLADSRRQTLARADRLTRQAQASSRRRQAVARSAWADASEHAQSLMRLAQAATEQSRSRQESALSRLAASRARLDGIVQDLRSARPMLMARGSLLAVRGQLEVALDHLRAAAAGSPRLETAVALLAVVDQELVRTLDRLAGVRSSVTVAAALRSVRDAHQRLVEHLTRLRELVAPADLSVVRVAVAAGEQLHRRLEHALAELARG